MTKHARPAGSEGPASNRCVPRLGVHVHGIGSYVQIDREPLPRMQLRAHAHESVSPSTCGWKVLTVAGNSTSW